MLGLKLIHVSERGYWYMCVIWSNNASISVLVFIKSMGHVCFEFNIKSIAHLKPQSPYLNKEDYFYEQMCTILKRHSRKVPVSIYCSRYMIVALYTLGKFDWGVRYVIIFLYVQFWIRLGTVSYRGKKVRTVDSPAVRSVNKSHGTRNCVQNEPQYAICVFVATRLYYKALGIILWQPMKIP